MRKLSFLAMLLLLSTVFVSAEINLNDAIFLADQGIIAKQEIPGKYRFNATITRAETIGIALRLKGIDLPNDYVCKNYFTDVRYNPTNNWICRAMELAADEGIISKTNYRARPQDAITRAEALAIIMKAGGEAIGMGGDSGYKYYFEENLYEEGGVGYRDAYHFGASWQAEVFYQYIRNILKDDTILKQNPLPNNVAIRAEVFGFAKNILEKNTPPKKEIKIEDNNVVLYENGIKRKNLTSDGNGIYVDTCIYPSEMNHYSLIGEARFFFIISHTVGFCETDAGHTDVLIFDGTSLVNLLVKIKQKFDIQIGYTSSSSLTVQNNEIQITGEFSYDDDCVDMGCPIYISRDKIKSLQVHVLKEPVGSTPGEFEFFFNPTILF